MKYRAGNPSPYLIWAEETEGAAPTTSETFDSCFCPEKRAKNFFTTSKLRFDYSISAICCETVWSFSLLAVFKPLYTSKYRLISVEALKIDTYLLVSALNLIRYLDFA